MPTNYVLIDFENVQPKSLDHLAHDHFKIIVFVGASQTKLPCETAMSLQRFGNRVEYIKVSRNGSNALDFHIAYYVGRFAVEDPSAHFHIISKDTGFDPLIQHVNGKKVSAGRVRAISEIRIGKKPISKPGKSSMQQRINAVVADLRRRKAAKPRTVKALTGTIAALFKKQLPQKEILSLIDELVNKGYVTISGTKINYALPSGG